MLARVKRIEAVRAPRMSPFEASYGSLDAWEAHCRAGIDAGEFDPTDMPVVMLSVRRWHTDGVYGQ